VTKGTPKTARRTPPASPGRAIDGQARQGKNGAETRAQTGTEAGFKANMMALAKRLGADPGTVTFGVAPEARAEVAETPPPTAKQLGLTGREAYVYTLEHPVRRKAGHGGDASAAQAQAARPWKDFHGDVDSLRSWTRSDGKKIDLVAHIESDPIGQAVEKRTGRTVEEILTTCCLFIGDGAIDTWHVPRLPESWEPKNRDLVRLLLGFAWQLSTLPNQDKETDRALEKVAEARRTFYAVREMKSRGGKTPRKTSSGNKTRAQLKRYWDECSGTQALRVRYCFNKMKASGNQKTERRIRKIAHDEGWPSRKQGT
jgi:hypothetical protein